MLNIARNFKTSKRGVSLTGYGLMVGLISVVALFAITNIGAEVDGLFTDVGDNLAGVTVAASPTGPTGCPNVGDTCDDGSINAGLTPDGNVPMYALPCDFGAFTGTDCSGTRTTISWGPQGIDIMPVCNGDIPSTPTCVTGEANTETVANWPSTTHPAAEYCYNLIALGYDDWYIPATSELVDLSALKNTGDFDGTFYTGTNSVYWTSSQADSGSTNRYVSLGSGGTGTVGNNQSWYLRCVRKE